MLQAQYKDLLQHPDICFDVPENGGYIEVKDAATHDTLAWVKSHDRASVEQVIARSQRHKLRGKRKQLYNVLMCFGLGLI
jgi:succinate-semialdehyde dehydrogenase/glutarate-semialdehyde dehydrogenase